MYRLGIFKIGLFISLFLAGTAFATFNDKELGEIVQNALREGGKLTHFEMTQIDGFKSIAGVSDPKTNVRVVKVVGYFSVGSDSHVKTLTVPVAIANTGSQIVAVAKLVDVDEDLFEDVLQKKYNQKGFDWFQNEYKGVDFQLKNVKGMVEFHGAYDLEGKSKKDATKAVAGMIRFARGFIHNLVTARESVKKERFKKLSDMKIKGPISPRDFERLVEDKSIRKLWEDGEEYSTWSFNKDDYDISFDLENHPDKLVIYMSRDVSDLDDGGKKKQFQNLEKFVKKNQIKTASETEVRYYDEDENWLSIEMTFPYDGTIKGKKMNEVYWDLWNSYAKKMASALK